MVYIHNDMCVRILNKIGLELINFMKSVLYKDTKMSYNYINHTHVVSNLICCVEMKDIVS